MEKNDGKILGKICIKFSKDNVRLVAGRNFTQLRTNRIINIYRGGLL
jgi:hypothetical protein